MIRRAVFLLVLVLGISGCWKPFLTDSHISMDTPVETHDHVTLDFPPVTDAGPLKEMTVEGAGGPGQAVVAIVDVDGLLLNSDPAGIYSLGENPVSLFREKLDAIAADSCIGAVVLHINSPGGGVTATDIMWRDLQMFRANTHRPVVACLMDVGTGGAYYLATGADQIVAHPTSVTGGIGVVLNLYNLRESMAQINVLNQSVKAGTNIDMGSVLNPLPPDTRKLLQGMADEFHARFKNVVAGARPAAAGDATTFDGRVFTASEAHARHLIDRVGYLDDAVAVAKDLAHLPEARVVLFHRGNDPAHSPYSMTPNSPIQSSIVPMSIPGLDRSRLPSFLYLWQPDPTVERLAGK